MPSVQNAVQPPEVDTNAKCEDGDNAPSSTTSNTEVKIENIGEELPKSPQEEAHSSETIQKSPQLSPIPNNIVPSFTIPLENQVTSIVEKESENGIALQNDPLKSEIKTEEDSCKLNGNENLASPTIQPTETTSQQTNTNCLVKNDLDQEKPVENGTVKHKENKDNEAELAELMRASSTIATPQPRRSVYPTNKRTRQAKEVESTLTLLQSNLDPVTRDKKDHEIALGYLTKVQDELNKNGEAGEAQFKQFIETLQGAEDVLKQPGGVPKLYTQICDALSGYEHLASEFLIFLEPGQALACNSFSQHQQLTAMMDFISKIQIHFRRQPSVLRMLVSTLTCLAERSEISGEEVQAAVLPLLKGVPPMLVECFLRLLPTAKPPESCMDNYAELMYDDLGDDEEPVETLNLPLEHIKDDTCVCKCHEQQQEEQVNTKLKYRTDHCVRCGLKFIHGKVFIHNGRCLRSARVTFLNEDMDSAIKRLTVQSTTGRSSVARCRKRNGNSFSQDSTNVKDSPPKLNNEESDNDDTENFKNFSSPKSTRKKRKSKHVFSEVVAKSEDLGSEVKTSSPNEAKQLSSPTTSSSCDILHISRKAEESPAEPDSTVPCDEEQVESSKDTPEEHMDVGVEQDAQEEEEDSGTKVGQKNNICEDLEDEEDASREEQNRDTCEELDEEDEEEEEERGSRGSREEQNRDTCEELDEDEDEEEERGSRGSREEQNRDTCEELEDEELELELEEEESRRLGHRDICEELGEEEEEEEELDLDLELDEEEESREQGTEIGEEQNEEDQFEEQEQGEELGEEQCEDLGEEQCEELGEEEEEEMEIDEEVEDEEEIEEQYFDESSQETEDIEQEEPSSSVGSPDKDPCWTRDEDKAILQAFQQGGTAQRMLLTVRQLLPERTPEQIMSRFHILLKLLQQMSSAARESNRK